eukprot:tig00020904_g15182.t1
MSEIEWNPEYPKPGDENYDKTAKPEDNPNVLLDEDATHYDSDLDGVSDNYADLKTTTSSSTPDEDIQENTSIFNKLSEDDTSGLQGVSHPDTTKSNELATFEEDLDLTFTRTTNGDLSSTDDKCEEGGDRGTLVKTVEYVKPFTILGEVVEEGEATYKGDALYSAVAKRDHDRDYYEKRVNTWSEDKYTDYTQTGKLITQQQVIADKMYLDDRTVIDVTETTVNPSDIKPVFPDAPTIDEEDWTYSGRSKPTVNPSTYEKTTDTKQSDATCEDTTIVESKMTWSDVQIKAPANKIGIHYDKQINTQLKTMCKEEMENAEEDSFAAGFLKAIEGKYTLDDLLDPDCKFDKPAKVVNITHDDHCAVNVIAEQDYTLTWTEKVTTDWEETEWFKGTKTYTETATYSKEDEYTKAATATRKAYFFQKGQETGKINTYIKQVGEAAEKGTTWTETSTKDYGEKTFDSDGDWHEASDWKLVTSSWKMNGNEKAGESKDFKPIKYVEHAIVEGDACFKTTLNKCPIMKIDVDLGCPEKEAELAGKVAIGKEHCYDSSCHLFDNDNHCPSATGACDGKGFDDETNVEEEEETEDASTAPTRTKCVLYMNDPTYKQYIADGDFKAALKFMFQKSLDDTYNYKGNASPNHQGQVLGWLDESGSGEITPAMVESLGFDAASALQIVGLYDGTIEQTVDGKAIYASGDGDGAIDLSEYVNCGKSTKPGVVSANARLEAETQEIDEAFGSEGEFSADELDASSAEEAVVAVEAQAAAEVVAA